MSNWYLQTGKSSDVVLNSKVSLSRNLSQFNFYIKEEEVVKLEKIFEENISQIGYGIKLLKLRELPIVEIQSLLEKGLINEKMVQNKNRCFLLINDEENISILINSDDHIKLQVFASGLEIESIFNLGIEIDEKLQEIFQISKNEKYGYLTQDLKNIGTGMKLSVILHLPALTKTKNIRNLKMLVRHLGIEIVKVQSPDIYKISNERTLGITEENILSNLKTVSEKIIEQERAARKILVKNQIELEDSILRSFGILSNCKKIHQKEAEELLSNVKFGTDLGIIKELTDAKIKKLYLYTKKANLNKFFGQELNEDEDIRRAEMIKQITKE